MGGYPRFGKYELLKDYRPVLISDALTNACIFLFLLSVSFVGRGFGRGRFPSHRAGFQGGRGFVPRGRGRGRFPFAADNEFETSYSEFRGGWRPFGPRGSLGRS